MLNYFHMYATAVEELRITNNSHIAAFPRAQALLSNKERDMFQAPRLKIRNGGEKS